MFGIFTNVSASLDNRDCTLQEAYMAETDNKSCQYQLTDSSKYRDHPIRGKIKIFSSSRHFFHEVFVRL